VLLTYNINKF